MQKIRPCLWFDDRIEEAVNLYVSIFRGGRITGVTHYGEAGPLPKGTILTMTFEIEGQEFLALNGGPLFTFSEAVSFAVECQDQAEIDRYWNRLTADGGSEGPCGWLKDRFGLSWQITPAVLARYLADKDEARSERVMRAMLQMKKIDVAALDAAYAG